MKALSVTTLLVAALALAPAAVGVYVDPPHPLLPTSACREAGAPEPCVPWRRLANGDGCREDMGGWVLEDPAELDAFWRGVTTYDGIHPCGPPQPAPPELGPVDWDREVAVAVVDVWVDWQGGIEIVEIAHDPTGGVTVAYAVTVVPLYPQIGFYIEQPYDLVVVQRAALTGPVTFVGPYGTWTPR